MNSACYKKIEPCIRLRPFVESIWVQGNRSKPASPSTVILPTTTMDLVFYYGDPFVELKEDGSKECHPVFCLTGQRTKPIKVKATGQTGIIKASFSLGVSFICWGFLRTKLPISP